MNKKEFRKEMRGRQDGLLPEYINEASEVIAKKVIESPEFQNCRELFVYVSFGNEPATSRIIEEAFKAGKSVYVPKCKKDGLMDPIRIKDFDDLEPGMMGIPEPKRTVCEKSVTENVFGASGEKCLLIIPCVAASKEGKRLGHGGGYYDRFLAKQQGYRMCLCFEKMLSDEIPMEEFDLMMDRVVSEI